MCVNVILRIAICFLHYVHKVPHIDLFSSDQVALGHAIEEIKQAHACQEHGTCFITSDAEHIQMNRFCLEAWGQDVVSHLTVHI